MPKELEGIPIPYGGVSHHMKPSGLTMRMGCWAWVQKYGDGGCGCDGVVVVAWFGDEVEAQNLPS